MKMENLQQRREELERKELQLKESLLKFDKFLKENDMKRARALKKTKDEKEAVKTKDKEIDRWVMVRGVEARVCVALGFTKEGGVWWCGACWCDGVWGVVPWCVCVCVSCRLHQEVAQLQAQTMRQREKLKRQSVCKEFLEKVLEHSPEVCCSPICIPCRMC